MKYVIDSSVAFKWSVKEADSDKADALLIAFL
jgi:predicted nucleic acid-binding protein